MSNQQKSERRRDSPLNMPRSPRPASMSPRNLGRKPRFGSLEIRTIERRASLGDDDAAAAEAETEQEEDTASLLQSPRQHPPKSPKSKPYRARGSRGRGGRRRRAAQKQAAAAAAAAGTDASVELPPEGSVPGDESVNQYQQHDKAQGQQRRDVKPTQSSGEVSDPPLIQRTASAAASAWNSTMDRPMETIEILTNGLCPIGRTATDDASTSTGVPPGLQRLRSFSSELSITSTLDSPRRSAAAGASDYISEPILEEQDSHTTTTPSSVPQISDDLKGLALIDEDMIVRSDTHITSMSTASTNFTPTDSAFHSVATAASASVASSYIHQVPSDSPRSLSEYSTNSTQAILNGHPGVLPPPMTKQQQEQSLQSHRRHHQQQYESRFLAGSVNDLYSWSEESSLQSDSNSYFVRGGGSHYPQMMTSEQRSKSIAVVEPPSPNPPQGRGRTFTDPTHASMGFVQPAPIPFSVGQMDQAALAAMNEQTYHHQRVQHHHQRPSQQYHQQQQQHVQHHQYYMEDRKQAAITGNRNRTFSDPSGGRHVRRAPEHEESVGPSTSQDDSASLFNTSPKSFLLGSTTTEKQSYDFEGQTEL
mmetsp:Transcript_12813/g.28361  ORF Transcript_12813/g.28361 Transcript_12813/m.28361 type:complete len:591 (+) Transcript_12813:239-2011(+)